MSTNLVPAHLIHDCPGKLFWSAHLPPLPLWYEMVEMGHNARHLLLADAARTISIKYTENMLQFFLLTALTHHIDNHKELLNTKINYKPFKPRNTYSKLNTSISISVINTEYVLR